MRTTHYEEILTSGFIAEFLIPEKGYITYICKNGDVYKIPENCLEPRIKGDFLSLYPDGTYKQW